MKKNKRNRENVFRIQYPVLRGGGGGGGVVSYDCACYEQRVRVRTFVNFSQVTAYIYAVTLQISTAILLTIRSDEKRERKKRKERNTGTGKETLRASTRLKSALTCRGSGNAITNEGDSKRGYGICGTKYRRSRKGA